MDHNCVWHSWTDLSSCCCSLSSDKPKDRKVDKESILKPFPLVTAKPRQERKQERREETTSYPRINSMTDAMSHVSFRGKLLTRYATDNQSYFILELSTSIQQGEKKGWDKLSGFIIKRYWLCSHKKKERFPAQAKAGVWRPGHWPGPEQ